MPTVDPQAKPPSLEHCPVTTCVAVLGGKWKPVILYLVANGVGRFGVLRRAIEGISKQMLTKQLRELEADGVLHREVFAEVPPRVEYTLTAHGRTLLPVIDQMRRWGERHLANQTDVSTQDTTSTDR